MTELDVDFQEKARINWQKQLQNALQICSQYAERQHRMPQSDRKDWIKVMGYLVSILNQTQTTTKTTNTSQTNEDKTKNAEANLLALKELEAEQVIEIKNEEKLRTLLEIKPKNKAQGGRKKRRKNIA